MDAIRELEEILNSVTGLFVDSQEAFALLQHKVESETEGKSWDSPVYYGDASANFVAHTTVIADRIARNAECGDNATFVGTMALVAIYSYWEDHYRAKIAESYGIEKGKIKSDVMGDIRQLRNAIIHNKGEATKEVEKCKVLRWFSEGEEIFVSEQMFLDMVSRVRSELHELRSNRAIETDA